MNHWATRRNGRRFFRHEDVEIGAYIAPRANMSMSEIFSNGVDYWPEHIERTYNNNKSELIHCVSKLQSKKAVVTNVVREFIEGFDYIENIIMLVSSGVSPESESGEYIFGVSSRERLGIKSIAKIGKNTKTYEIFKSIEERYLDFLKKVHEVVAKSNEKKIFITSLKRNLSSERYTNSFREEKYSDVPLAKVIIILNETLEILLKSYGEFLIDHKYINSPKKWGQIRANISPCGVKFKSNKVYEIGRTLNTFFYLKDIDEVVRFEGRIVQQEVFELSSELTINFEFTTNNREILLAYLQMKEIERAIKISRKYKLSEK